MSWQRKLEDKIKTYLDGYTACHDFWHLSRVRYNALKIASHIKCDIEVLEGAALLHDIGYRHFEHDDHNHHLYGMKIAQDWLPRVGFPQDKIKDVIEAIRLHDDYHKGKDAEKTNHVEVMIIQDADKIETMGAIGIARLTYFFGEKGYRIYTDEPVPDTDIIWLDHSLPDQIRRDSMIKWDKLNFDYSREISKERNEFLKTFYDKLVEELLDYHGDKNESEKE